MHRRILHILMSVTLVFLGFELSFQGMHIVAAGLATVIFFY